MPNWCYNSVTITGPKEEISSIKATLNEPYTRQHDQWNPETKEMELKDYSYDNPIFAFWNIVKPTNLQTYILQEDPNHTSGLIDFQGDNWYDWNVRNWGTKWDVAVSNDEKYPETELTDESETSLAYRFNTAWSPPEPAMIKLSELIPNCLVTLYYKEETGWGGESEYQNGERISESSYGWQCYECDHEEDETPWCEDCDFDTCPSCGYNEADEPCDEHKENHH